MLNLCRSSTSESELLSKSNRIKTEVRRGRGCFNELSLSRSRGLMIIKLDVELEDNLKAIRGVT